MKELSITSLKKNCSGAENAANIAKSRGGVTLESTIKTQNIVMSEWDLYRIKTR